MKDKLIKNKILNFQRREITEYFVYKKLSEKIKDPKNKEILKIIAEQELKHFNILREYTKENIKPNRLKIWLYVFIMKIFGITFAIKLMERGEEQDVLNYEKIYKFSSIDKEILKDEEENEKKLISLINEERLKYVSSIVLGLNDALIELTGALAGFTLAFANASFIAIAGLITGIAASLSMAVSGYIYIKNSDEDKNPVKASFYTGFSYILTVIILVIPFLFLKNIYFALSISIFNSIFLIFLFSFYISIVKDVNFKERFLEMILLTLGVAIVNFFIGFLVKKFLGLEI